MFILIIKIQLYVLLNKDDAINRSIINTIPYKRVTKVTSKGVGLQLQSLLAMKSI